MLVKKAVEISDAKIQFVSLVDKAANKRQFLVTKSETEDGRAQFSTLGKILKVDEATHYVAGIVYEPLVEDAHGNFMAEDEIRKAAYWFAKNGDKVDLQHSFETVDGVAVVENYIAPCDMQVGDTPIVKGTWLMTAEVTNADVWTAVQKGEITGFSMGGVGKYSEEDVDLSEVSKSAPDAPEKAGLFKKLAEYLGFSVVQKGAMLEAYENSVKRSAFWDAFYTLEDLLYRYNWASDSYEYETNEAAIKDALTDFSTVLVDLLAEPNIAKALTATAPLLKAGKKMSSANQKKLDEAYQALTELRETLADEEADTTIEKEDTVLTKTEAQAMIDAAIAKAAAPAAQTPAEETVTAESAQKMIDEAVSKALENQNPEDRAGESVTAEGVQKMIDESVEKAVGSLRQARGLPSNLNGEKEIEKTADVFAGLFV